MVSLSKFFKIKISTQQFTALMLIVLAGIVVVHPIGFPININNYTRGDYDAIQNLKPGDIVVLDNMISTSEYTENRGGADAIIYHLATRPGIKIIFYSVGASGDTAQILSLFLDHERPDLLANGKVYGQDWVWFGYLAGGETGIAAFASDIWGTMKVDVYGKDIKDIPMMANIKTMRDVTLYITLMGALLQIRQIWQMYHIPVATTCITMSLNAQLVYYNSGQVVGVVAGMRGGTEYEELVHRPGYASANMDGINIIMVYVLIEIAVANVIFASTKLFGKDTISIRGKTKSSIAPGGSN